MHTAGLNITVVRLFFYRRVCYTESVRNMNYYKYKMCIILSMFITIAGFSGERTVPVDIFLMIDASVSMAEPGKFESVYQWVRNTLIAEMLITGDWVSLWEFYEEPHELLTLTLKTAQDRAAIIRTVDSICPNKKFTDIGKALDAMHTAMKNRKDIARHKILLLITDLEHDAPWTSKYRGKQSSFESPYLAEARIIRRDNWYEITLDMDIQDAVVHTTKALYNRSNLMQ